VLFKITVIDHIQQQSYHVHVFSLNMCILKLTFWLKSNVVVYYCRFKHFCCRISVFTVSNA